MFREMIPSPNSRQSQPKRFQKTRLLEHSTWPRQRQCPAGSFVVSSLSASPDQLACCCALTSGMMLSTEGCSVNICWLNARYCECEMLNIVLIIWPHLDICILMMDTFLAESNGYSKYLLTPVCLPNQALGGQPGYEYFPSCHYSWPFLYSVGREVGTDTKDATTQV